MEGKEQVNYLYLTQDMETNNNVCIYLCFELCEWSGDLSVCGEYALALLW